MCSWQMVRITSKKVGRSIEVYWVNPNSLLAVQLVGIKSGKDMKTEIKKLVQQTKTSIYLLVIQ